MRGIPDELGSGRGFADLSSWRKVWVSGGDAIAWLNDLVSADISDLGPGRARRALLLSPTGRIRAEFTVARADGGAMLIQDPSQPRGIGDILSPYVLSSDVALEDRTHDTALFALPGVIDRPAVSGAVVITPSCLGTGCDLLVARADREAVLASLGRTYTVAGPAEVEAWRIGAGIPRLGIDVTEDDLPQEAGLAGAVSFDKGCYLGQEAVAKVQNLGHPRRLLIAMHAEGHVGAGEAVFLDGRKAGVVTSAAPGTEGTALLARVRWDAREGPFRTGSGTRLLRRA